MSVHSSKISHRYDDAPSVVLRALNDNAYTESHAEPGVQIPRATAYWAAENVTDCLLAVNVIEAVEDADASYAISIRAASNLWGTDAVEVLRIPVTPGSRGEFVVGVSASSIAAVRPTGELYLSTASLITPGANGLQKFNYAAAITPQSKV